MLKFLTLTIATTAKATWLVLRAISYLLCGLLFGVLPLLIVVCAKGAKWSLKATLWTIGAVTAASLFIVRSV